jgi:hypothetical protein
MLGSVIHAGQTYRIAEIASDDFKVSGQTPKDFGFSFANSIDLSLFSEGRIPIDRRRREALSRAVIGFPYVGDSVPERACRR